MLAKVGVLSQPIIIIHKCAELLRFMFLGEMGVQKCLCVGRSGSIPPLLCHTVKNIWAGFQNMHSDTKLTAKNAADAKTSANSMSPRGESTERHPGPGFGLKSGSIYSP